MRKAQREGEGGAARARYGRKIHARMLSQVTPPYQPHRRASCDSRAFRKRRAPSGREASAGDATGQLSGAVTVVEVSQLGHSSIADTAQGSPICMTNVRLHLLPHGATYDLHHRVASPPPT